MNAFSKSRPGIDQRVALNAVPAEKLVPSTKPLKTKVSSPALSFKIIPSGSGWLMDAFAVWTERVGVRRSSFSGLGATIGR